MRGHAAFVDSGTFCVAGSVRGRDRSRLRAGAGFISHTHYMVVGPACAGINFLVISFLTLYFSFARHFSNKARWFAMSAILSFGATIVANGLRIFVSAHLWTADIYGLWMTPDRMHRIAGVAITIFASALTWSWISSICSDPAIVRTVLPRFCGTWACRWGFRCRAASKPGACLVFQESMPPGCRG